MNKLFVMCGLPASGKSTYALQLAIKENAIVVSTDNIRGFINGDENSQKNNDKVFEIAHKLIYKYLNEEKNVIFDATNINLKKRIELVKRYRKYCDKIICVFVAIPYEICLERNSKRERKVPEEVIKRMYYNFYVPQLYEGFDRIETIFETHYRYHYEIPNDISQDNPHHTLKILEHCKKAYNIICKYTDNYILQQATLFHDIGKFKTKQFKDAKGNPSKIAHFYRS